MLTYCNPAEQEKSIRSFSKMFDVEVALVTNKKIVFCCADKAEAKNFFFNLNRESYAVEMKKGLKTDRWYVAVYFH